MKIDTRIKYTDSRTGQVLGIHTGDDNDFVIDRGQKIVGVKPYTKPQEEDLLEIPD